MLNLGLLLIVAGSLRQTPPVATLHVSQERQLIYGFGGSQTYNGDALMDFPNRDAVYRALFSDLKLDIWRLRNYNGYEGQQAGFDAKTREFATGALKWGTSDKRGGKAPVRLMFTAWSPPAYLKSNKLISGRSDGTDKGAENVTLRRNPDGGYAYGEYADWWLASVRKFKELAGVYPDYIALQNELDLAVTYEGCEFLPTEGIGKGGNSFAGYAQALAAVSDKFTKELGAQAPKIVGPETFTISTSKDDKNHVQAYADPATPVGKATLSRLFGVSFHIYGTGAPSSDLDRFHQCLESVRKLYPDKPLFQTEYLEGASLTSVAGMISDCFTIGNVSAYFVWISARSAAGPGYGFVYFNPYDGSVERRERFYAVKHFSEFVGEGWHRIETECPDPALRFSGYRKDGQLAAVLINSSESERKVTLALEGGDFGQAKTSVFRSSEGEGGERWRVLGALGSDRVVTLTPHSVVTVKFDR